MTPPPSTPRRYLAIYLPMLAEDCWRLDEVEPGPPGDGPLLAFTDRVGNAVRLTALSRAALAIGLTLGLTLADAHARVPELVAIERDHAAEARLLARIVAGCVRYTPMAEAQPPDGAILDIAGCAEAYGGERALAADLAGRLAASGVTVRLGHGATPESARARARFGGRASGDLKHLPVAALEAAPEVELALRRAGLRTIGDLACRPRRMLAARFGDLALRLGRLLEEEDRRITPRRPPSAIVALRRFAEPIGRTEQAFTCLGELLGEVGGELERRHQGGRRFEARLFRSDGAVAALAVETSRPTRDPAMVMRLFDEKMEALADPIDPGFGFDLVRLDVPMVQPLAATQDDFTQAPVAEEALAELVDRLAARLGARRIRRAGPADTHIPECASTDLPAGTNVPPWQRPAPGEPPLRPLRLFDPPQPVAVTYGLPEGPPRRFVWRDRAHVVARWEGPERIAAEWWRRRDRGGLTRDYYRVEDEGGHRFWLFRHGLHDRERSDPTWYLHGLFA